MALVGWIIFSGARSVTSLAYLETVLSEMETQEIAIAKAPDGSYARVNGKYKIQAIQNELQSAKFDVAREIVIFFLIPLLGWGVYYAWRLFTEEDGVEAVFEAREKIGRKSSTVDDEFAMDVSGRPIGAPRKAAEPQEDEVAGRLSSLGITVEKT